MISKVLAVGCRILPSCELLGKAIGVKVAAVPAATIVDVRIPENDCTTATACGVALSAALALALVAGRNVALDKATVTGDSSLPCSDRVIVTKEVTSDGSNELEEMVNEA